MLVRTGVTGTFLHGSFWDKTSSECCFIVSSDPKPMSDPSPRNVLTKTHAQKSLYS